jgi:preprotein translocase SecE subunit
MSTTPEGPKGPASIATPKFKRGMKGFLTETKREMKKVNWPSKKETNRLTFVVMSLVVGLALMLSAMGYVADTLITLITKGHV